MSARDRTAPGRCHDAPVVKRAALWQRRRDGRRAAPPPDLPRRRSPPAPPARWQREGVLAARRGVVPELRRGRPRAARPRRDPRARRARWPAGPPPAPARAHRAARRHALVRVAGRGSADRARPARDRSRRVAGVLRGRAAPRPALAPGAAGARDPARSRRARRVARADPPSLDRRRPQRRGRAARPAVGGDRGQAMVADHLRAIGRVRAGAAGQGPRPARRGAAGPACWRS